MPASDMGNDVADTERMHEPNTRSVREIGEHVDQVRVSREEPAVAIDEALPVVAREQHVRGFLVTFLHGQFDDREVARLRCEPAVNGGNAAIGGCRDDGERWAPAVESHQTGQQRDAHRARES